MDTKRPILALDFDGVVANSIGECLVTAYNAYAVFKSDPVMRQDLAAFSEDELNRFRDLRSLIRRGEDYVYLLQALDQGQTLRTQDDFDGFADRFAHYRDEYRKLFYDMRVSFQTDHTEEWVALNPLYPGIADFLRDRGETADIYIITTKDLASVQLILAHNHVHLPLENQFQATRETRKPHFMEQIRKSHDAVAESLYFVDDHADTLVEVKESGQAQCFCAAWGYNTVEQRRMLNRENIPALSMEEFITRFGSM